MASTLNKIAHQPILQAKSKSTNIFITNNFPRTDFIILTHSLHIHNIGVLSLHYDGD